MVLATLGTCPFGATPAIPFAGCQEQRGSRGDVLHNRPKNNNRMMSIFLLCLRRRLLGNFS